MLKQELQKSNPLSSPGCNKRDCFACIQSKGEEGQCHRSNINYEIGCQLCKDSEPTVYIGETARNLYNVHKRMGAHAKKKGRGIIHEKAHEREK